MQQIERYGVIALVFLLVTIVAISFWGDSKSPGFWSRLTGKAAKKEEVAKIEPQLPPQIADPNAPLSPIVGVPAPSDLPSAGGASTNSPIDLPGTGVATVGNDLLVGTPTAIDPLSPGTAGPGMSQPVTTAPTAPIETHRPVVIEPPARVAAGAGEHVVARGDSLARIAKTRLGAESRWTEIAELNPGVNPKALVVGQKLRMPTGAAPVSVVREAKVEPKTAAAPKKAPVEVAKGAAKSAARTAVVKKGDTLRSIARRELGDERRWKEIQNLNPGLEPSKLAIGQRLKLPGGSGELIAAASVSSTNASGSTNSTTKKPRVQ